MAEFAAHLTLQSYDKPSIFELLAQESLSSGLRRAAQFLIRVCQINYYDNITIKPDFDLHLWFCQYKGNQVLFQNDPNKFAFLYHHFDNIYLVFDLIVQYSHLRAFNASFSENFYGLKRINPALINTNNNANKLSSKQFYLSLVFLVGWPYIKIKLDNLYERLKFALLEGRVDKQTKPKQYYFVQVYPTLCFIWNSLLLYYQIKYAVGNQEYYSPLIKLANVQLACITQDDLNRRNEKVSLEPNLRWDKYLKRLIWIGTKWSATGLGAGLSLGAFFIQFLDYWYSMDNSPPSFAPMPIPPPPEKDSLSIPKNNCPICKQKRRNDTVLATTGYVFCYSCIKNFITQNGRCPVIGYPSTLDHLVKLYPPEY